MERFKAEMEALYKAGMDVLTRADSKADPEAVSAAKAELEASFRAQQAGGTRGELPCVTYEPGVEPFGNFSEEDSEEADDAS